MNNTEYNSKLDKAFEMVKEIATLKSELEDAPTYRENGFTEFKFRGHQNSADELQTAEYKLKELVDELEMEFDDEIQTDEESKRLDELLKKIY